MSANDRCPGQSSMFWRFEDVHEKPCPDCGYLVEFFKTDLKRKCPRCQKEVLNNKADFSCAEWCLHAEECLGPSIYSHVKGKLELENRRKLDLDRLLNMIPQEESKVKDIFLNLFNKNTDPGCLFDVHSLKLLHEENSLLAEKAMKYYRNFTGTN